MALFKLTAASRLGCATALGLVMAAPAARADVTATDVWADWKGYLAGSGYQVSGQENLSGDDLTVSDITLSMELPEEDTSIDVSLGEITFSENGDGTVSVAFPSSMPMNVTVAAEGEEPVNIGMDYKTQGFLMTVSGDPNDITYNYTAAEIAMSLNNLVVEGTPVDLGTFDVTVADVVGVTTMKVGNLRMTDQTITTGAVNYTVDMEDPEGSGGTIFIKGQLDGTNAKGTGALPLEMDANDMSAAMQDGFAVDATMTYDTGATEFRFEEAGETVEGNTSSDSGEFIVALGSQGLTYDILSRGMNIAMSGGEIPLPIELALAEAGFNLTMPVAKGEDEQDFALGLTLGDFTMSDLLWSIFDPAGQLPRDPATIDLDMTGKAKLFFDLMDPDQMASLETDGGVPGELNALNLNALTLKLAGAELNGSGAFTFDNTDLETFDGMPAPEGTVDLTLDGGNGLLDKLIAMGLVPEDQAMGVRMMMGLFAVPGDGEDSLKSTIEVKSDGQVLANGQRLR